MRWDPTIAMPEDVVIEAVVEGAEVVVVNTMAEGIKTPIQTIPITRTTTTISNNIHPTTPMEANNSINNNTSPSNSHPNINLLNNNNHHLCITITLPTHTQIKDIIPPLNKTTLINRPNSHSSSRMLHSNNNLLNNPTRPRHSMEMSVEVDTVNLPL